MTFLATLLAAALQTAAAPAPLATGPDAFADFQSFCLAHRGDVAAPISDADAKGWTVVPAEMVASQLPAGIKDGKVRVKIGDGGGVEYVFTGAGEFAAPGIGTIHANICFLGRQPGDYTGGAAKLADFAKTEPVANSPKAVAYAFSGATGAHLTLDVRDKTATAAAIKSGEVAIVFVQPTQGGAGVQLGYAVPAL